MRRVILLMLLFAVAALQMGSRWVVYAAWKANQAYIAAELCENRDQPELECEGRCCLKAELKKTEAQERKTGGKVEIPEFAPAPMPEPVRLAGTTTLPATQTNAREYAPLAPGKPRSYGAKAWQPPAA